MLKLFCYIVAGVARNLAMFSSRRRARSARKLANAIRLRAKWLNIACAYYKADIALKHAEAIDAACDYVMNRGN